MKLYLSKPTETTGRLIKFCRCKRLIDKLWTTLDLSKANRFNEYKKVDPSYRKN